MFRMFRIRWSATRLAGAAATTVLAALCLTACDDGTGVRDEGTASDTATLGSPTAGGPKPAPSTAAPSVSSAPPASSAPSSQSSKAPNSDVAAGTCESTGTKLVAAPLSRPVDHLLLTVTNTGSRTCYLYGYPALRFTGAQALPPVIEDSHPQAVTTLGPGQSGYASVILSAADGRGTNGRTARTLTVWLVGPTGTGSAGAADHPSLPAQGVHIDDTLTTTYWEQSMDAALTW
ncbi:Protein of unknown function [Actinacidiphila yanglinensis]|uniref:DUF4232 domain-containing protein n=1 Tax=Actinacidiphila yanglinensis TaxID=310779 RepID=A0A1H6DT78_9ACTN|nr:DUF4232 domain-containing protein [Actinacidiphila yanglinensis]SEG88448.1 Protein of unknown function [Actinacidiphila yanglinensis]